MAQDSVDADVLKLVSAEAGSPGSGNGTSEAPSISADGRFVAFHSLATNLLTGINDQNGKSRNLRSIMGPKGAMLVFFRSADW